MVAPGRTTYDEESTHPRRTIEPSTDQKAYTTMRSLFTRSLSSRTSSFSKTPKIAKLIDSRKIRELSGFLLSDEGQEEAAALGVTYMYPDGGTLLHRVCRLHPPLEVVGELIRAAPGAVLKIDKKRHAPLHVAAAHGSSPQVFNLLLRMNPAAAGLRDKKGRTPLHLYCEKCCRLETCDTGDPDEELVKGPLLSVVESLCGAHPQSVNVEDASDMTPLEYCINNGAHVDVVKYLQKVSTKAWNKLREIKIEKSMSTQNQRRFVRRNSLSTSTECSADSMATTANLNADFLTVYKVDGDDEFSSSSSGSEQTFTRAKGHPTNVKVNKLNGCLSSSLDHGPTISNARGPPSIVANRPGKARAA